MCTYITSFIHPKALLDEKVRDYTPFRVAPLSCSDSRTDAAHAASTFALQRMVRLRAALVPARLERAVPTDTAAD